MEHSSKSPRRAWIDLKIQLSPDRKALLTILRSQGIVVTAWAEDVVGHMRFPSGPAVVSLHVTSSLELGLRGACGYDAICAAGLADGLALCRPEIGAALALSYNDQPLGERLLLAMRPFSLKRGGRAVFAVTNTDGRRRLEDGDVHAEQRFQSTQPFAFVSP